MFLPKKEKKKEIKHENLFLSCYFLTKWRNETKNSFYSCKILTNYQKNNLLKISKGKMRRAI
ncbi:hypothetical protein SAMN06265220_102522 [Flavobacterium nitrogenifigens]|uniref:Uncharacterized protein n=1 Tax=Flavobacterium nitrogenifigens TaxID=1617283 RepID=A0A521CPW4_9FLAO|nr:hypothetical protein SAMN06265220_102522 [Flavobacterium nitrogenifigens]